MKARSIVILLLFSMCSSPEVIETNRALFQLRDSSDSGIDFVNQLVEDGRQNIIDYLYFYNGGGVSAGDINNDGLIDLYFSSNQGVGKLYLNLGQLKFREVTQEAGITFENGWTTGVSMVDINGDGFLDIYLCRVGDYNNWKGRNLLFLNNGDLTFKEVASEVGLDFIGFSTQSTFLDFDRDGDLDMFLLNHAVHTTRSYALASKRLAFDSLAGDRFFENKLNEGIFQFRDISQEVGIYSGPQGYGLGVVSSDINLDGYPDLYVCNDFHEDDYVYLNTGKKTFIESRKELINHTSRFSMGLDIADINNDGLFDIFSLDMLPGDHQILLKSGGEDENKVAELKFNFGYDAQYSRNAFQLQRQNGRFSEIALMTETFATDWSWSVLLQDYDNDGFNDIFITNGIFRRPNDLDYINFLSNTDLTLFPKYQQDSVEKVLIEHMPTLKIPNYLFRNKGGVEFENVSQNWGLSIPSYSNGAAYADLDNDGDLDLIVNNINHPAFLFENRSDTSINHFLQIDLKQDSPNSQSIGAKVWLWTAGVSQVREVSTTRGFLSSVSTTLHFGLGNASVVDSLLIQWPDGSFQRHQMVKVDQRIIIEKRDSFRRVEKGSHSKNSSSLLPFFHAENTYQDYDREVLIPEKLSTEGPAVVIEDFNEDGKKDIFIGGASGQEGGIFLRSENGYRSVNSTAFDLDNRFEDVDAAAFDMDNDGDMDLYVVSGGNDHPDGDRILMDRVYLNDGSGLFSKLEIPLPSTNGACVAVTDLDGDPFPDLFVGSRSVPGAYGISPFSFILKNQGGRTFSIVKRWQLGMVTDAEWSDLDGDQIPELIICGDWMPITIMRKVGGDYVDKSIHFGLEKTHGLWNVIKVADINGDGNLDLVVGNLGLNSKFQTTEINPIRLYLDDFDDNGHPDPVIFYTFNGHQIPFSSKDALIRQMPFLKKQFLSYDQFTKVSTVNELIGNEISKNTGIYPLFELQSCAFIFNGDKFDKMALPMEAQMSTLEDIEFQDIDGDGLLDLVYVGNFFGAINTLGRYDANAGGVLLNSKSGFVPSTIALPINFNYEYRHIEKIDSITFIAVPNSQSPVIFEINVQ